MMRNLTLEATLTFHKKIVAKTGGSSGIRDQSLIESAVSRAFATFDGIDLHKTEVEKVSIIACGLIRNHGFVDGNKRIGVSIMLLLLKLNGIEISYTQEELIDLGLRAAEGKLREDELVNWINSHRS